MQQSNIITRRRGIMGVRADTGSLPPELRHSVEAMNKAFSDIRNGSDCEGTLKQAQQQLTSQLRRIK